MGVPVDIPDNVSSALESRLKSMYAELESDPSVHRNISYERSKKPKVRYEAVVSYYWSNNGGCTALFDYSERLDMKAKAYVFEWYCTRDW